MLQCACAAFRPGGPGNRICPPDARLPYQVKMQYPRGIMPSLIRSFPYEILKINNLQDGIIFDIHIIKEP
jgi:hypothetical protein